MHPTSSLLLLLLAVIHSFAAAAVQPPHHHGGGCAPAERDALLSFKMAVTNDSSNRLGSWRGHDCCSWRGVSCSNRTGHVIGLHLRNPNQSYVEHIYLYDFYYYGCYEHDPNALFGEISPSLLSLKHLEKMDLSNNCLLGPNGRIPEFLGSLENLSYLNLSGTPFIGRLPSHLGNLSKLQYLDLSRMFGDDFQPMYSTDISWLMKLSLLQYLNIGRVNLWAIADWPHQLNMIPSLRVISLRGCLIDSASQFLPHFNLTKLEKLDLSRNYLRNSVASSWFWKATSLKYLGLNGNELSGQFSDGLGNMTSLQVLDLSHNMINMTCNLKKLCSLKILDLSYNFIKNGLEEWFPKCKKNKLQEVHFGSNNFTSLRILDVSFNQLVGPIPPGLWNLTSLTTLDLSGNQLTGSLVGIEKLRYLTSLDLSFNDITGPIPPGISNLTSLTTLDISGNQLTGSLPADIGKLKYLTSLDLSCNDITGPIPPESMNSTSLTKLYLSHNQLNGSVPSQVGSLSDLIDLQLDNNNFSGMITTEHLAGLKSLKNIDLSNNNLKVVIDSDWVPPFTLKFASFASCQMGPFFPAWLQQLETRYLDISSTGLKGEIPNWFWSTFSQAFSLNMANNQISGRLPAHLDGMACADLYLGSNMLTGSIPSLPINTRRLDISNNSFPGTLPSNFEALRLEVLNIHSNRLGGHVPESICKRNQLWYLDLSNNILDGEIPQCSSAHNIMFLLLSNNSLSGNLPAFLQNCPILEFLDLSLNKFSGGLPAWIGELTKLQFLLLGRNTFFGNIPIQITNIAYMQCLDLSYNNFSGAIPRPLSNLTSMKLMSMRRAQTILSPGNYNTPRSNHLVFTKGQQLIYGPTIAYLVSIDLSNNFLTGEIPEDITSLGALINLDLSSNYLSGKIPNKISDMKSLESFDLSENKFSGEIPSSLSDLSYLIYLNLSYNNLSGRIPSGRQLDILNLDNPSLMYIGNNELCGPPVKKNCSGNDNTNHGHLINGSKQDFEPMTFCFGLVLGLVTGHWIVFCPMLFKKTWRIAYFRFFDKLYDKIHVFVAVKWVRFTKNTTTE